MALIVQKYGGTSVGDPDRLRHVARRVVATLDAGNRVAVVVSGVTYNRDEAKIAVRRVEDQPGMAADIEGDDAVAKVSIVGLGMKDHAGVATRMFDVLGREGINIQMISTSEIKISVVIEEKYTELAVRALHDAFVDAGAATPAPER